jgi:hypothetical protein
MTTTLYISEDYDLSPQAYKNFYRRVIEPEMMKYHRPPLSGADFLRDYNAHWNNETKCIVFETEQDLTYFVLRWT